MSSSNLGPRCLLNDYCLNQLVKLFGAALKKASWKVVESREGRTVDECGHPPCAQPALIPRDGVLVVKR